MTDNNENRDETKDVGSGRRRISRDDKGNLSKKAEDPNQSTKPPTTNRPYRGHHRKGRDEK